jgi:hypothetical protein
MDRAAVDFLRGACPFFDDDFLLLDEPDEALFFLLVDVVLLGFFAGVDAESWASSPLP